MLILVTVLKLIAFMLGLFLYGIALRFWDDPSTTIPRTPLGCMLLFGIGLLETSFTMLTKGMVPGLLLMLAGTILLLGFMLMPKSELRMMIDRVPPEGR